MVRFFTENWGTVLVCLFVAALILLVVIKLLKDRKKGERSCGCGCENCPSAGICHTKSEYRKNLK